MGVARSVIPWQEHGTTWEMAAIPATVVPVNVVIMVPLAFLIVGLAFAWPIIVLPIYGAIFLVFIGGCLWGMAVDQR